MKLCWAARPTDRPVIEEVLEYIEDEYDAQLAKARPLRDLTGQVKRVFGGEGLIPFDFVHVWEGLWSTRNVRIPKPHLQVSPHNIAAVKGVRQDPPVPDRFRRGEDA